MAIPRPAKLRLTTAADFLSGLLPLFTCSRVKRLARFKYRGLRPSMTAGALCLATMCLSVTKATSGKSPSITTTLTFQAQQLILVQWVKSAISSSSKSALTITQAQSTRTTCQSHLLPCQTSQAPPPGRLPLPRTLSRSQWK
jgi:hypothetical protein